jgi:hypothetical protein
MTGNTEDISYRMELFKNSSVFKYAKVDIPEEKPKKPLKTKSKRMRDIKVLQMSKRMKGATL